MAGPVERGGPEGTDDRKETPPTLTKEQIDGHVPALKSLIKSHNQRNKGDQIRLDFESEDIEVRDMGIAKGKEVMDEDLGKPFKETRRTPLTRRIIEFAGPEYKTRMAHARMVLNVSTNPGQVSTGWFERLPHDSINEWADLREAFAARSRYSLIQLSHPNWPNVFSSKIPTTVNEMMERLDDFVRSEEAYARTGLPKGEVRETHRKTSLSFNIRDSRSSRNTHPGESRRNEYRSNYRSGRDTCLANRTRDDRAPYRPSRGEYNHRVASVLTLESLTKRPKEILATKTQLHLPAPCPMLNPLRSGNTERYCDYHQENIHYTNDCIQLRKQLEMTLESGKSNDLVKDVRQRGKGPHSREAPQQAKDVSEEPLIVEAEVKRYLVRRVYVDEGSSEHCFENLDPRIRAKLKETKTDLVVFAREISKPLGKIELELYFVNGGLCRRTSMKFIVVRAPLPCNIILGRHGLKTLRAISSTVHSMMKFPTQNGVATLEPSDLTGVPHKIIEYTLNVNPSMAPVCQKRRTFSMEKGGVITNEVAEWVKAGIVHPVKYPTYSSNPVLVKKGDGTWRMCIDFKILNPACLKDYYPFPNIDCKVESVMRSVDQLLHQNTLRAKNAGSTYQRLVDSTFQYQIGRNLEAYVDDMVIKSKDEKMLLTDIAETVDNLKRINMKLNLKKCSFRVEEGKFLGYMVSSEGIRANPKKTKALADLESPRTLKEMQSLSGKVAALNRFLAKSAERSLPFFNTLKNITKENKHEYRWTKEAEEAFQQMKKLIMDLPSLTFPWEKETLYAYRTLNEAKRNYVPREKLALSLIHMTRRLRRYFEAHLVKVITNQPIENILNNTETSKKLANYAVELGVYNITFIPRDAVKGQVLADFLSDELEGENEELYFRMPEMPLEKDDTGSYTLFTDGASSPKGSRASLVLIGSSGIEYTYALRLIFSSTNNEAEYEAPPAGLRIARQMNISNLEVKVDSKLVASQININYEADKDSVIKYLAKARRVKQARIDGVQSFNKGSIDREGIWPKDKTERRCLRAKIGQYAMESGVLFKKGPLPPVMGGAKFVIVAIDYFTKWIEAKPLVKITGNELVWKVRNSSDEHSSGSSPSKQAGRKGQQEFDGSKGEKRLPSKKRDTKQRWSNTTTRRFVHQDLGRENLCFEEMKQVGLKTRESWDQNGNDHTGSWKHMKMAPTSYRLWKMRRFLEPGMLSTSINVTCRNFKKFQELFEPSLLVNE
nr:hypothetical protein [Tanacetum cinerariifolium]